MTLIHIPPDGVPGDIGCSSCKLDSPRDTLSARASSASSSASPADPSAGALTARRFALALLATLALALSPAQTPRATPPPSSTADERRAADEGSPVAGREGAALPSDATRRTTAVLAVTSEPRPSAPGMREDWVVTKARVRPDRVTMGRSVRESWGRSMMGSCEGSSVTGSRTWTVGVGWEMDWASQQGSKCRKPQRTMTIARAELRTAAVFATPSVTRLIATPVRSETRTRDNVGFADARLGGGLDVLRHELRSTMLVYVTHMKATMGPCCSHSFPRSTNTPLKTSSFTPMVPGSTPGNALLSVASSHRISGKLNTSVGGGYTSWTCGSSGMTPLSYAQI